ncbi:hypothetical protein RI528_00095 [Aeromonas veronii]|uniref:hypothetical protein n=1 Tax=Aeromonas TaxID=642 RepID=UPI00342624AC
MYFNEQVYEKFLMDELGFSGSWQDFVSSYVTIITKEHFKSRWLPSHGEVKKKGSWLELSLRLRIELLPKKRRFGGKLLFEAENIMKNLIRYADLGFEFSHEPSDKLKVGGEYWYNPSNQNFKGHPVIINKINGSTVEYYDSAPKKTRINRRGREVVDFDPSTIRSFADISEMHEILVDPREIQRRQKTSWVKDAPSIHQLSHGFCGEVKGMDLSVFALPKDLSSSQLEFIAGHIQGWLNGGANHEECSFMANWIANNLLQLRHEYFDSSEYLPSPLFSGSVE